MLKVVKAESATVRVPQLDFEIPTGTQRGTITTVEGLLSDAASGLRDTQVNKQSSQPKENAAYLISGSRREVIGDVFRLSHGQEITSQVEERSLLCCPAR